MKSSYLILIAGALLLISAAIAGCVTPPSGVPVDEEARKVTAPDQVPGRTLEVAQMDEPLIAGFGDDIYQITVSNVIRGHRAETLIREANIFNPYPDTGNELLLINIMVDALSESNPVSTPFHDFYVRVEDEDHHQVFARMPPTHPLYPDILPPPGEEVMGWLLFEVPSGKEATLVWNPSGTPAGYIHLGTSSRVSKSQERGSGLLLSPRMPFIYMDARKSNELSIMYQYSTFRKAITYESIQGFVDLKAGEGKKYLLACLQVTHRGNYDGLYYLAEIPRVSAYTLYDQETIYTPMEIPDRRSDHISVGELYTETILERKENKQGFLVFMVPDDFSLHDAHLGVIPLKEIGEVFWTLQ